MSDEIDGHPSVIIAISTALSNSKEYVRAVGNWKHLRMNHLKLNRGQQKKVFAFR